MLSTRAGAFRQELASRRLRILRELSAGRKFGQISAVFLVFNNIFLPSFCALVNYVKHLFVFYVLLHSTLCAIVLTSLADQVDHPVNLLSRSFARGYLSLVSNIGFKR
jgi:hypothetical protein